MTFWPIIVQVNFKVTYKFVVQLFEINICGFENSIQIFYNISSRYLKIANGSWSMGILNLFSVVFNNIEKCFVIARLTVIVCLD